MRNAAEAVLADDEQRRASARPAAPCGADDPGSKVQEDFAPVSFDAPAKILPLSGAALEANVLSSDLPEGEPPAGRMNGGAPRSTAVFIGRREWQCLLKRIP